MAENIDLISTSSAGNMIRGRAGVSKEQALKALEYLELKNQGKDSELADL